jgi:hypothetical protein
MRVFGVSHKDMILNHLEIYYMQLLGSQIGNKFVTTL